MSEQGRSLRQAARARLRHAVHIFGLPWPVARFYVRAWILRSRLDDAFSLWGVTRPRDLVTLLRAARGSTLAVEVGTGTAWTAIALAIDEPRRRVVSFDPVHRAERDAYLRLVAPAVARRIEFVQRPGEQVPDGIADVGFLFIDAAHDCASTLAAFEAWRPRLAPGAAVVFHDFNDPQWPGVTEAIRRLGLRGRGHHRVFVWHDGGG